MEDEPAVSPNARPTARPDRSGSIILATGDLLLSEIIIVGLPIVAAQHPFPDVDGYRIADEAHAGVREAGVDATEMPAAGLCLPIGPVMRRLVVGATHAVAGTEILIPEQLTVFDIIRERLLVVGI